jgi:hypothetical protein
LATFWIPWVVNRTWRAVLWHEGGGALEAVARELDGGVRPRRAGWEVRSDAGRVFVRGGIRGVRTRLDRADGTRHDSAGWMPADAMLAWLRGATESP